MQQGDSERGSKPALNVDRVIAVVGVLIAFLALAKPWNWLSDQGPMLGDQLEQIRESAARSGRSVRILRKVWLRNQAPSYLVVTTPKSIPVSATKIDYSLSDELLVYDTDGEHLETPPALVFRPSVSPSQNCQCRLDFELLGIGDFNVDGLTEVIGAFSTVAADPVLSPAYGVGYPLVLDWEADPGAYRLVPLLSQRPEGLRFHDPGDARKKVALYEHAVKLIDPTGETRLRSYGSESAALVRHGNKAFFVSSFTVRDNGTAFLFDRNSGGFDAIRRITSALHGSTFLQNSTEELRLFECQSTRLNLLGPIAHGALDKAAIRRNWLSFLPYTDC